MFDLTPDEWTAVRLSLRIAIVATVVALPFGVAVAWLLARKDFWGKALLDGIVHLPLVLPPVVTGYLLLISFGRRALLDLPDQRRAGRVACDHLGAALLGERRADVIERILHRRGGEDRDDRVLRLRGRRRSRAEYKRSGSGQDETKNASAHGGAP